MKKILCVLLSFILVITAVSFIEPSMLASAATRQELQDKIDELDDEIAANRKKLNSLKNDQAKKKEYLETLERQIETVEEKATKIQTQIQTIDNEIEVLNTEIKQISREITQTEKEIVETENNITSSSDLLAAKLRSAYMNGNESTLKILMGADSLASFLTRLEMMKRTSENDKRVIDDFKQQVTSLKKAKVKLEEDKKEVDAKKAEKVEKKSDLVTKKAEYQKTVNSLEGQYVEIEEYIADLDKSSAAYQQYIKELQQEKAAADAEIDRILSEYYATSQATTLPAANQDPSAPGAQGGSQGGSAGPAYVSGESWAWPLGNQSCYISSPYGYRSASISGWSFHGGTDISGGGFYGKAIYASRSGRVITAVTSDRGYGVYVMIDHGDGYSSLYAHMSTRYVSTGDTVQKGQMIGRAGSSGNSTGPHLHFEIRYYGEKKDPMNYVRKP